MKKFLSKVKGNLKKGVAVAAAVGASVLPVCASEGTVVSSSDWSSVINAMTNQISVSTVVGVIATVVAAGIGLVFMWWGVRKAAKSLMKAFASGRLKF